LSAIEVAAADPELELLLPDDDVDDPEVSIVIPALNEELTIVDFVRWCHEGLAEAGVVGEILIVDSSSDATSELAVREGARVLRTPKRAIAATATSPTPAIPRADEFKVSP